MRFRLLLTILAVFAGYLSLLSQTCLPDSIIFSTQLEIDQFSTNYPGCTEILGRVEIIENDSSSIKNLLGLAQLTTIGGSLDIKRNDSLSSLAGLENLKWLGGSLNIQLNPSLRSLEGLQNIHDLAKDFDIYENDALTDLAVFENLNEVGGNFIIAENPMLNSLEGLENLHSTGGFLVISNNDSLSDLKGLENLRNCRHLTIGYGDNLTSLKALSGLNHLGGDLTIYENALASLEGLENIDTIAGSLSIRSNTTLSDLKGLDNLSVIGGLVIIQNNTALTDLKGLDQLTEISNGIPNGNLFFVLRNNSLLTSLSGLDNLSSLNGAYLQISANPVLTDLSALNTLNYSTMSSLIITANESLGTCDEMMICNAIAFGQGTIISNNAIGCNDKMEVLSLCDGELKRVRHQVFYDQNQNKLREFDEPLQSGISLLLQPEGLRVYGSGLLLLEKGNYSLHYDPATNIEWDLTTDSTSFSIKIDSSSSTDTFYFGVIPNTNRSEVLSYINAPRTRCDQLIPFEVQAKNRGTTINDGTLWLQMDENIDSVLFVDLPDTIIAPDIFGWHYEQLFPGQNLVRSIYLGIPGPLDFSIGDSLHFASYVHFSAVNGEQTSKTFHYASEVRCSFDPNDKLVTPSRDGAYTLFEEDLIYTIRFQNTGNDVAYDVVVRDTLDERLNPATFQLLGSSHPAQLSTNLRENRFLSFEFKAIYLPDSISDPEGSQGYISYVIKPLDDLEEETAIQNTASIYFDTNPPVVTNTTRNLMVSELPNILDDISKPAEYTFSIAPNPAFQEVQIEGPPNESAILELYELSGKRLLQQDFTSPIHLDLQAYPAGVYFICIQTRAKCHSERLIKL